jgi:glycosyltransferase involved in cell wall biosynthesis
VKAAGATAERAAILIHCPQGHGGLAEHTHYQARALHELGVPVRVLASRDFLEGRATPYIVDRVLPAAPSGERGLRRRILHAAWLSTIPWRLAWRIVRLRPKSVLLASYSEYLSPLWIWPHRILRRALGIRYGANLHDPVRDFRLGPGWWHRLSVRLAFAGLDYVIVHETPLPPGLVPARVQVHEAPVGLYDLSRPAAGRAKQSRSAGGKVLLCFGHIRDNKNIDLLIRALAGFPEVQLVVAGPPAAAGQRPEVFYRDLAQRSRVGERFRLVAQFIADEDVADYFREADWVAVTYSASFRSQSGVLNIAARARKLVLASSGPGPLKSVVQRFGLGVFVEPDSVDAIVRGLRGLMDHPPAPDWEGYERYASWEANARTVMAAAGIAEGAPRE